MRISDIPGLQLPTWQEIVSREYHPWIASILWLTRPLGTSSRVSRCFEKRLRRKGGRIQPWVNRTKIST